MAFSYWTVVILVIVLLIHDALIAWRDFQLNGNPIKLGLKILLLAALATIVWNTVSRLLELGLEIPFIP